ncbi:MAG: acyl-CoA thioesterase [Vicinamibacterales bacterium]
MSRAMSSRPASVRVRYAETDQMGVAYYANYFAWFEVGRTEWLRQTGWTYREMEADGVFLPVIEAACTYRRPLRYDDRLSIRTTASLLSPVRIRFDYQVVVDEAAGHEAAIGYTVHAATGPAGRPVRLPGRVRALFAPPAQPGT